MGRSVGRGEHGSAAEPSAAVLVQGELEVFFRVDASLENFEAVAD